MTPRLAVHGTYIPVETITSPQRYFWHIDTNIHVAIINIDHPGRNVKTVCIDTAWGPITCGNNLRICVWTRRGHWEYNEMREISRQDLLRNRLRIKERLVRRMDDHPGNSKYERWEKRYGEGLPFFASCWGSDSGGK